MYNTIKIILLRMKTKTTTRCFKGDMHISFKCEYCDKIYEGKCKRTMKYYYELHLKNIHNVKEQIQVEIKPRYEEYYDLRFNKTLKKYYI